MEDTITFKSEKVSYEVFISPNDEHCEVYEKENPKDGLIFNTHKQIISFINSLTDIAEERM